MPASFKLHMGGKSKGERGDGSPCLHLKTHVVQGICKACLAEDAHIGCSCSKLPCLQAGTGKFHCAVEAVQGICHGQIGEGYVCGKAFCPQEIASLVPERCVGVFDGKRAVQGQNVLQIGLAAAAPSLCEIRKGNGKRTHNPWLHKANGLRLEPAGEKGEKIWCKVERARGKTQGSGSGFCSCQSLCLIPCLAFPRQDKVHVVQAYGRQGDEAHGHTRKPDTAARARGDLLQRKGGYLVHVELHRKQEPQKEHKDAQDKDT